MLNLYELNETYQEIINLEVDEETLLMMLNELEGDIKEKANNIGKVINSLQAEQLVYKTEISRLQAKMKACSTKETSIKSYLSSNLETMGIQKLECELFKYSFRKSTTLEIDDNTLVPSMYKESIVTEKIDKAAIKKAYKNSVVPGCHLVEKQNMQIK